MAKLASVLQIAEDSLFISIMAEMVWAQTADRRDDNTSSRTRTLIPYTAEDDDDDDDGRRSFLLQRRSFLLRYHKQSGRDTISITAYTPYACTDLFLLASCVDALWSIVYLSMRWKKENTVPKQEAVDSLVVEYGSDR